MALCFSVGNFMKLLPEDVFGFWSGFIFVQKIDSFSCEKPTSEIHMSRAFSCHASCRGRQDLYEILDEPRP